MGVECLAQTFHPFFFSQPPSAHFCQSTPLIYHTPVTTQPSIHWIDPPLPSIHRIDPPPYYWTDPRH
ncbi:MAG: hypothetical protein HY709_07005 [Candidatus Latescibacteria bacterium]|nr:hypothetical protein [Candidatus Latescibacterota bacterium]